MVDVQVAKAKAALIETGAKEFLPWRRRGGEPHAARRL